MKTLQAVLLGMVLGALSVLPALVEADQGAPRSKAKAFQAAPGDEWRHGCDPDFGNLQPDGQCHALIYVEVGQYHGLSCEGTRGVSKVGDETMKRGQAIGTECVYKPKP